MSILFFAVGCATIYTAHCDNNIKLVCACILCAMAMLCIEIAKCRDTYAMANPVKGDRMSFSNDWHSQEMEDKK